MSTLRRACLVASVAPVMVAAACVDLGNLAAPTATDDGGDDGGGEVEGGPTANKCPQGQKSCKGGCVPTDQIAYGCAGDSCEPCSVPFADTVICEDGKCAVGKCQGGRGSCDGNKQNGCEADLTLGTTCGSCTAACPTTAPFCNAGQCVKDCGTLAQCGNQCVDLATTATHCGSCGNACAVPSDFDPHATPACVNSTCQLKCATGYADCGNLTTKGCEPLYPYYVDGDNDGVGGSVKMGEACKAPAGTSLVAGDCLDSNAQVKPGQTTFFAVGYTNASGQMSYDYDCNGAEETDPTKPVGDCAKCRVGDYVSVSRANPPAKPDLHCGSTLHIYSCGSASGSGSGSASSCYTTSASSSTVACR